VRTKKETGSVTAEMVLTLPVLMFVIALAIGAMGLQLQKLQLINSATMIAGAIARGEDISYVDDLVLNAGLEVLFEIQEVEDLVCVTLSKKMKLPGLDIGFLDLVERACSRTQGQ
jgi:hypothetical protein